MAKWAYTRLYVSGTKIDETTTSIVWEIWIHNMSVRGDKEYIRVHQETTTGQGYVMNGSEIAFQRIHALAGELGMQGWELISIDHRAIYYQSEFGEWWVPSFYFKKNLE